MPEQLVISDPNEVGRLTTDPEPVKITPMNEEMSAQREALLEKLK